ncbi:BRF1-domain-containing protein [Martensiomyces pterosporus]|nr:BRF1-domain-containing protein [Martensiomyces pterosporus]
MGCRACGGTEIEHDSAKGMSYCTGCGEVCEENTIVSEVTFGEAASGAAIVQGSFIRAGQTRANMGGPGRYGSGQESREMTLYNSRRRIQRLATALGLSEHYIDSAQRYFTLALNLNFTRGRRSTNVSAACLYVVCRMEKNSQMLIDFSDVLQVSVFKLGATFAKLVNVLNLQLPIVDPSLYISRFASMLEFGDKTQQVCLDAIRLVQRMDRDWIRTGRRPAGICGACLLIAARMHNFRRTQREIIRVVKIADTTLRRRLDEFRKTPSGELTVADFRSLWLEQSADPPAFVNSRLKARKAVLASQQRQEQAGLLKRLRSGDTAGGDDQEAGAETNKDEEPEDDDEILFNNTVDEAFSREFSTYLQSEKLKFISYEMSKDTFDPDVSTWDDIDDDEVRNIMLTEEEVSMKTEIWDRENKEFMEEQARKRLAKEMEKGPNKRRRSTKKRVAATGATPLESAQNMLAMRRLSKKINYDVLGKLLDSDGPKPKVEDVHANMIPSGAPSRMISVAGTPAANSGYATPALELANENARRNAMEGLPEALAKVVPGPNGDAATETIVYEEGAQDAQSAAPNAPEPEDDDEDEEEEYEEQYDDAYAADYGQYNEDDGDYE